VLSPVEGEVTKLGYPYNGDLQWRYVEVTDHRGWKHRLFYCHPTVTVGDTVLVDGVVGYAQDITQRYPDQGMLPHSGDAAPHPL
jgi:hypothetical protein